MGGGERGRRSRENEGREEDISGCLRKVERARFKKPDS